MTTTRRFLALLAFLVLAHASQAALAVYRGTVAGTSIGTNGREPFKLHAYLIIDSTLAGQAGEDWFKLILFYQQANGDKVYVIIEPDSDADADDADGIEIAFEKFGDLQTRLFWSAYYQDTENYDMSLIWLWGRSRKTTLIAGALRVPVARILYGVDLRRTSGSFTDSAQYVLRLHRDLSRYANNNNRTMGNVIAKIERLLADRGYSSVGSTFPQM